MVQNQSPWRERERANRNTNKRGKKRELNTHLRAAKFMQETMLYSIVWVREIKSNKKNSLFV
jgi:hypothetical protein